MERKDWNRLIALIVALHNKTKDERLVALHGRVVDMALSDHEKELN